MNDFRDALADRLRSLPRMMPHPRAVRGIVTVAGGRLYFRLWWHLAYVLRGLGCTLPLELWHLGGSEMDVEMAKAAADLGATVIDATAHAEAHGHEPPAGGWQAKAYAMRHSGFADAMFLDADQVPARDPTYLFVDPAYLRTGAIYWPDLPPGRERKHWVPPVAWRNVGLEPQPAARPFESGQMLVNRRRHIASLDVALFLNDWSDYVYQWVYGDKDTFLLAAHLTNSTYSMPPKNPRWRSPAICQHDMSGELVFQHACQAKESIVAGSLISSLVNRRFAPDAAAALRRRLPHLADR